MRSQISAIMQAGNLYVYCMGNPVRYRDESGEIALVDDLFLIVVIWGGLLLTGSTVLLMTPEGQRLIKEASNPKPHAPAVGNKGYFSAAGAPNPQKPNKDEDEKENNQKYQVNDEKVTRQIKKLSPEQKSHMIKQLRDYRTERQDLEIIIV